MAAQTPLDLIADRIDRLLARHAELHRTNLQLLQQVQSLTQERDHLRVQTQAVRQRLDALIDRLPAPPTESTGGPA